MRILDVDVRAQRGGFRLSVEAVLEGPAIAVLGPSGAGKTTLLEIIAGLRRPDSGHVHICGQPVFDSARGVDAPPQHRHIGYVFQDGRLFPHLTVRGNLLYGWRLCAHERRRFGLSDVVELLALGALLERRVDGLSGGERQRVAIGRALLAGPRLLLLDEPLTGLDRAIRGQLQEFLVLLRKELAMPVVCVTHSSAEAQMFADDLVILESGETVAYGPLTTVLADPHAMELATTLGFENLLDVEICGHDPAGDVTFARFASVELSLPRSDRAVGTRAVAAVRPGDVLVANAPPRGLSARNTVEATVVDMVRLHEHWLVVADAGQLVRAEITNASVASLGIRPGAQVWLALKTFSLRWC